MGHGFTLKPFGKQQQKMSKSHLQPHHGVAPFRRSSATNDLSHTILPPIHWAICHIHGTVQNRISARTRATAILLWTLELHAHRNSEQITFWECLLTSSSKHFVFPCDIKKPIN
jgi:hypothetical protein